MTTDETIQELSARLERSERGRYACAGARDRWMTEALQLREAIRETIMENLGLADGDICTLKRLKDAINFELPEDE